MEEGALARSRTPVGQAWLLQRHLRGRVAQRRPSRAARPFTRGPEPQNQTIAAANLRSRSRSSSQLTASPALYWFGCPFRISAAPRARAAEILRAAARSTHTEAPRS